MLVLLSVLLDFVMVFSSPSNSCLGGGSISTSTCLSLSLDRCFLRSSWPGRVQPPAERKRPPSLTERFPHLSWTFPWQSSG